MKSWGVAANGYLNTNVRIASSYDHSDFEGGAVDGDRATESVFLSRIQIAW